MTTQPAINLTDYEPLIYKMSLKCRRKLPPSTIQDLEDLQQEGRKHALYVARKFDPTRGVKFMTLLTLGLTHRYGRILHEEWKRAFTAGPDGLETATEPASQGAVDSVLLLEVRLLDRYQNLLRVSYREEGRPRQFVDLPLSVLAEFPASPRRRFRPAPLIPRLTS